MLHIVTLINKKEFNAYLTKTHFSYRILSLMIIPLMWMIFKSLMIVHNTEVLLYISRVGSNDNEKREKKRYARLCIQLTRNMCILLTRICLLSSSITFRGCLHSFSTHELYYKKLRKLLKIVLFWFQRSWIFLIRPHCNVNREKYVYLKFLFKNHFYKRKATTDIILI